MWTGRGSIVVHCTASTRYGSAFPGGDFRPYGLSGIRTHWIVAGMPPGTTFTLDVPVQGISKATGQAVIHIDRWIWKVAGGFESARAVLDLLHSIPVSTAGIPPIAAEPAYYQIRAAIDDIEAKFAAGALVAAQTALTALFGQLTTYANSGAVLGAVDPDGTHSNLLGYGALGVELEYIDSVLLP